MFEGEFDRKVLHPHLGRIERGTVSIEYFWLDRWYNVFRFHEPQGTFRNYYCNVAMPPVVSETTLDFVDLDIDLVVDMNAKIAVLDEDEFLENAAKFGYPPDIRARVKNSVEALTQMALRHDFPFDHPEFLQPST